MSQAVRETTSPYPSSTVATFVTRDGVVTVTRKVTVTGSNGVIGPVHWTPSSKAYSPELADELTIR